jgi:periplasmic protein TonB
MDTQQLLNASVLDIIFEGRNKEYGAYCLRKEYNRRLQKAMLTTGAIATAIIILFSFKPTEKISVLPIPEINITPVSIDPAEPPVIVPPKPAGPPPMVRTIQFTSPPKIVADKDINPDEKPPENAALENVKIDVFTQDGPETDGIVPPQGSLNGVIGNIASNRSEEDEIFRKVEIESSYPGGPKAWARFLNKTFNYPQNAAENGIQGVVNVKFVVDQSGNVSNIEAVEGPEELKAEAMRVIRKSGKWNPAMQNGRMVKSFKQQAINFKLETY